MLVGLAGANVPNHLAPVRSIKHFRSLPLSARAGRDSGPFLLTGERASEFEVLAETELLPEVRLRYRIAAQHYRELAERDERSDQARTAERLEPLRAKRQEIDQHSPGQPAGKKRLA